jgi:hypothetical protein
VPAPPPANQRLSTRRPLKPQAAIRLGVLAAVAAALANAAPVCQGIEMFTYFGDGSRIGLPSLEVPIEAYRGIPLRSDRLRARRAAQRKPGSNVQVGTPGMPGSMTVRTMPQLPAQAPFQARPAAAAPTGSTPRSVSRRAPGDRLPVAPDPDMLLHQN